jgi:hypothetical protein
LSDLGEIRPLQVKFDHFCAKSSANFQAKSNCADFGLNLAEIGRIGITVYKV